MQFLTTLLYATAARWQRFSDIEDRERGDVPGWVMVTVMTAILVVAIMGVFEPEIKTAITTAIDNVSNSGTK